MTNQQTKDASERAFVAELHGAEAMHQSSGIAVPGGEDKDDDDGTDFDDNFGDKTSAPAAMPEA